MHKVEVKGVTVVDKDPGQLVLQVGGELQSSVHTLVHEVTRNQQNELTGVKLTVSVPETAEIATGLMVPIEETITIEGPFAVEVEVEDPSGRIITVS